jgi:hypothetical protein
MGPTVSLFPLPHRRRSLTELAPTLTIAPAPAPVTGGGARCETRCFTSQSSPRSSRAVRGGGGRDGGRVCYGVLLLPCAVVELIVLAAVCVPAALCRHAFRA